MKKRNLGRLFLIAIVFWGGPIVNSNASNKDYTHIEIGGDEKRGSVLITHEGEEDDPIIEPFLVDSVEEDDPIIEPFSAAWFLNFLGL